jgi:nucleotide-binding universal stress UspA family protein
MPGILIAVDLNHDASWEKALPEAVREARSRKATLHLLAIVPDFGMSMVRDFFPEGFEKKALEETMMQLKDFTAKHVPEGIDWQVHIGHGDIDREILGTAEKLGVDLIVMASHPPSEMRTFLVGSHADRVVHRAPVSVLVVR